MAGWPDSAQRLRSYGNLPGSHCKETRWPDHIRSLKESPEELESLLMSDDRLFRGKRLVPEKKKLLPAETKKHDEKIDLNPLAGACT